MPWVGGLNGAQYSQIDLNKDGNLDLAVYDRSTQIVHCFVWSDNQYIYAPSYNNIFPQEIYNFMQLIDYNKDGKIDLFTAGNLGLVVYKNTSIDEHFSWEKISPFITYESISGNDVNLQLAYNDYPYIGDLDQDGDVDILSFATNGLESSIIYYKNWSMEEEGVASLNFLKEENRRWGDFEECQCDDFAFGNNTCFGLRAETNNENRLHVGGKSVLVADFDNDNILELITSHQECTQLYNFTGAEVGSIPIYTNYTSNFPENTEAATFNYYPNSMRLKDPANGNNALVISPNVEAQLGLIADFESSNWYYTIDTEGEATLQTKAFLQEDMIDLGIQSSPAFYDYDQDGDLDMLVAYTSIENEALYSGINLYKNIGNKNQPQFELIDDNYLSFKETSYTNLLIQIIDLNSDGLKDLAFQATENGQNKLYVQMAMDVNSFSSPNPIDDVFIGFGYSFHFTQVTGSEAVDLLIGKSSGGLILYENNGSANGFSFTKRSDNYLSINDDFFKSSIKVFASDLNNDQNEDLIVTDESGYLKIYPDYKEGSNQYDSISIYNSRLASHEKSNFGGGNISTVAPIYNETYPSIIIGSISGGLKILRNNIEFPLTGPSQNTSFLLYPNPTNKNFINLKVDENGLLTITKVNGQVISKQISLSKGINQLSTSHLTQGIYICTVQFKNGTISSKKLLIY